MTLQRGQQKLPRPVPRQVPGPRLDPGSRWKTIPLGPNRPAPPPFRTFAFPGWQLKHFGIFLVRCLLQLLNSERQVLNFHAAGIGIFVYIFIDGQDNGLGFCSQHFVAFCFAKRFALIKNSSGAKGFSSCPPRKGGSHSPSPGIQTSKLTLRTFCYFFCVFRFPILRFALADREDDTSECIFQCFGLVQGNKIFALRNYERAAHWHLNLV